MPPLPAVRELAKASRTAVMFVVWMASPPWESIHLHLQHEAAGLVVVVIVVESGDQPARIDTVDQGKAPGSGSKVVKAPPAVRTQK